MIRNVHKETDNRWERCGKNKNLLLLIMSSLAIRAKSRLYSAFVFSFMLYGSETWPVKDDVMRLTRNDVTMVRWVHNV